MALCTRIFRKVIRAQLWNSPPSESRRRQFLFSAEQPRPFTFLSAVTQPDSNITAKLNKDATRLPSLHGGSPMLDEASWLVGSANASLFLKQGR
ncbi:uncharacterized protein LOC143461078 isoform X2 [Clavelina lepadiformis]|uniref:uncharacterized protein LOC143461078 isoform X2 n=1 Tax=Clavelina lepadiformis TaxID=159417 RepID=UPI00404314F4